MRQVAACGLLLNLAFFVSDFKVICPSYGCTLNNRLFSATCTVHPESSSLARFAPIIGQHVRHMRPESTAMHDLRRRFT